MPDSRYRQVRLWVAAAWLIALVGAFSLDRRVAQWVRDVRPVDKNEPVARRVLYVLKLPGYFPATLCVAALIVAFDRRHLRYSIALALSGIVVGALYSVIKWACGRLRPVKGIDPFGFHPPRDIRSLWHPEDGLCFPSGHASLAFASAMCLTMLWPRAWWLFFAVAAVTAGERVIENAHYLSDVIAGAGIGTCAGWLVTRAIASAGASRTADGHDLLLPGRNL